MTGRPLTLVALAGLSLGSFAWAASIDSLDVTREGPRYALIAHAQLNATPESIYAVLVDYGDNHFERISSVYKESKYLDPAADGTPMVHTRMEGCLLFYCLTMNRTERLETERPHRIKTITLPEQSDFKFSVSEWVLEPANGGTQMTYQLEMEPDFKIPPVIGPWYLKRTLSSGGVRAVNRIEVLAMELDAANAAAAADAIAAANAAAPH